MANNKIDIPVSGADNDLDLAVAHLLIDSHCHLDAPQFDTDRTQVISESKVAGVKAIVIPAILPRNFATVTEVAHSMSGGLYTLGIHPVYVRECQIADLDMLENAIIQALDDDRFIGLGEIGLDYFIKEIATGPARDQQEYFYNQQLKLAFKYKLPVMLHVRRSQDIVLKYLRRLPPIGGIAHAFNGSHQQAEEFIKLGFLLGLGGGMTYTRSRQIRRIAQEFSIKNFVLETDSPDIPPAWLHGDKPRNTPAQVLGVAQVLAELRDITVTEVIAETGQNMLRVFPRLAQYLAGCET